MKTHYKHLLLGIACLLGSISTAQVSAYHFAQSYGTYVPITGGTVIATATTNTAPGNLASTVWNLPNGSISFPFVFNGVPYTGFNISCNGYITFGLTPPLVGGGTPISAATAYDGAIAAWGRATNGGFNLGTAAPFHTSELRVEEIGVAPNRTLVVQFDKWRYASGTGTVVWLHDYQIRLAETSNVVEIVYGAGVMAGGNLSTSGFNCQVGLRGATNADFNNRQSFGLFDQSIAGTLNNHSQTIGVTGGVGVFMPSSGLTYKWFPPCSGIPNTPTIAVNSSTICEGDTLNFSANGNTPYFDITYQWQESQFPGGPYSNVTGPSGGTTFASYQIAATPGMLFYVLVVTCPNVPSFTISNEISVDVKPLPIIDILSNPALNTSVTPIETCFGETYTLTAIGANTYNWLGGPATDSYVVQPAGNPSYEVTGISIDGCTATRTLDIQVNPLPVMPMLASPSATICPGKPVVVGASGCVTYTWVAPNSNAFIVTVTPTITTTYSVIGTGANSCTNMATQQIVVNNVSPITASSSVGSATICKGEQITLSASGSNTYTWTTLGTYTTGQTVMASPHITTTYTLTGIDLNGCESQTTFVQFVSECVGLNETSEIVNHLSIYPNPNNGVFTVELTNGTTKMYDVMDLSGRIVLSVSTIQDRAELNIHELANGVYYLRVQTNNAIQIMKVVKQ